MDSKTDNLLPWTPRQLVLAAVLLCAGVGALWSSWCDWLNISYHIEEHSHVFLAAPFAAAIIYVNRRRFRTVRAGTSWAGPLMVAAGWAMAWYGFTDAHQSAWHMGAVLVALGAVVTVLGHDVLVKYWAAFLLLAFMVPVPNGVRLGIALPLQTAMATIVERSLSFFGEPVSRQHNQLMVNGVPVSIAEACNGLRMVFTLILVCWLFAFVTPLKNWVRWMIILLSPLTALACNVIRLIPTVLIYGHGSKETAEQFHDYAGWAMVVVAFFLLMGVVAVVGAFGVEVRDDDEDGTGGSADKQSMDRDRGGTTEVAAAV